jgi:hypothetical protein
VIQLSGGHCTFQIPNAQTKNSNFFRTDEYKY